MACHTGNLEWVQSGLEQLGSRIVPTIVKAQISQHARVGLDGLALAVFGIEAPCAAHQALPWLAERARVFPCSEYPAADVQRLGHETLEDGYRLTGQRHSAGVAVLGGIGRQLDHPAAQVDSIPPQCQQFALAHAGGQCQAHDGLQHGPSLHVGAITRIAGRTHRQIELAITHTRSRAAPGKGRATSLTWLPAGVWTPNAVCVCWIKPEKVFRW